MASPRIEPRAASRTAARGRVRAVLEAEAAGGSVAVVGCGAGGGAIALARAGFRVTGLDASPQAIGRARRRAARARVCVRWETVDLLVEQPWPLGMVDVAVCERWPPDWTAAMQRRVLRRLRRHLAPAGLLVMNARRGWTGLRRLLAEAGFAPAPGDPIGRRPGGASLPILVARPLPVPPRSLAATEWRTPPDIRLDLRYAPDESALLDPEPRALWERLVRALPYAGGDAAGHYAVDDPFGAERGTETVARFFGIPLAPAQLTFAAGVTSLLHDLGGLADGGPILAPELVHGDLEAWALARGTPVRVTPEPVSAGRLIAALEAVRPALLHLDRPGFAGPPLALHEVDAVARAAARVGAVVVIDESAAPYLGPGGSAARLVHDATNLVVLRGFTKAYSLGGLRAAFAVASPAIAERVRELVASMQVAELALRAALALLDAGDIFGRLRGRIHVAKPAAAALLARAGLRVRAGHPDLPWLAVDDAGGVATRLLARRGIAPLRPVPIPLPASHGTSAPPALLRLTTPLAPERLALLARLLDPDDGCAPHTTAGGDER